MQAALHKNLGCKLDDLAAKLSDFALLPDESSGDGLFRGLPVAIGGRKCVAY